MIEQTDGEIIRRKDYPSPNPQVKLEEITYSSDGLLVKGLLATPKAQGRYDGLLYLRGGIQHVGMVRPARIAQFASHGLVVFAPYYRGNRGGEGKDEFAGEDRNDAILGVEVLKQQSAVDSDRIHLFSFSRGGIMALWTAIMRDDLTSSVAWAGVSDVIFTYKERQDMRRMMKRVIGGTPNNQPDAYRQRTALFRVQDIDIPTLIIHGTNDTNVSFEQALLLENALRDANKEFETWYLEGFTHYIPPEMNRQLVKDAVDWMKRQGRG